MILAAGSVSTEVVYLAYKGDEDVTWSATCGSFGGFCRKATASVALTFIVVLCYAGLSLISSYRLFSKYEAPPVSAYSNKATIETPPVFHGWFQQQQGCKFCKTNVLGFQVFSMAMYTFTYLGAQ